MQLLSVLAQASVANFDMTKLPLDDPEWVLDLGPYLGFDLLKLLLQGGDRLHQIQGLALAALHRNMPTQFALRCGRRHVGTLISTLVASVAISIGFLSV